MVNFKVLPGQYLVEIGKMDANSPSMFIFLFFVIFKGTHNNIDRYLFICMPM